MNTNLFLYLEGPFVFYPLAPIREYSCSFMAGIPCLECHISKSIFQTDAPRQIDEHPFSTQRLEHPLAAQPHQPVVSLLECALQPFERLFLVSQSGVNHRQVEGRNITIHRE